MDYVVIDGDTAVFQPSFGAATVVVLPGTIRASGPATFGHRKVCVSGDEASVSVPGCMYFAASYPIPGTGTLEIASLAGDQVAGKTKSGEKPLLHVGSEFTARFKVESPAQLPMTPPPNLLDATPEYSGRGAFVTSNTRFRGA